MMYSGDELYGGEVTSPREDGSDVHKRRTPSVQQLMEWDEEGGCEATDGCWVEPDGHCEHGKPSWLLAMGMI